jgi:hypothetical protein
MKKMIPALAVLALIGGISSAYAIDTGWSSGPQPAPNGTVDRYGQQTNGYPGQDPNPSDYRANGPSAVLNLDSRFATQPAPNGTVNPYTGQQTNGY